MENGWTERIKELEAENTRLRMLRDAAESRAQGLEAQVAKWKAISPANAMAWQERAENAEAQVAALTAEKDMLRERVKELEAANRRLREALDGIITVAKIICNEFPVGTASLYGWVLIGQQALKEASHEG
jgi:chromosome segregation ATPase